MEDLIKAIKSLLSDIEAMQSERTYLFGSFSEYEKDYEDDNVHVEWPNLAIAAADVKAALAALDGPIVEGELADTGPLVLSFIGGDA